MHQELVFGDFNTIAEGFAKGGLTSFARKKYARLVVMVTEVKPQKTPPVIFSDEDCQGVCPHEEDSVIISAILMGFNVKHILVD